MDAPTGLGSRGHEPQEERAPAFSHSNIEARSPPNGGRDGGEAASPPGVILVAAYSSNSSEDDRLLHDGASSPPISRARDSFPRPSPPAVSSSICGAAAAAAAAAASPNRAPPTTAGHADNGSVEISAADASSSGGAESVGSAPSTAQGGLDVPPPQPPPAGAGPTAPGASPSAILSSEGTPKEKDEDGKGGAGGDVTAGDGDGGGGDGSSSNFGRVSVLCRFRRFGDTETERASTRSDWLRFGGEGEHESGEGGTVSVRMGGLWSRRGFDRVFKPGVEQVEVCACICNRCVWESTDPEVVYPRRSCFVCAFVLLAPSTRLSVPLSTHTYLKLTKRLFF